MPKDEFSGMALSADPEERRVGIVASSFLAMNEAPQGEDRRFELYISPLPREELKQLFTQRRDASAIYHRACAEYGQAHPWPEEGKGDILKYSAERKQALPQPASEAWATVNSIDEKLKNEKERIYVPLIQTFRDLMVSLLAESRSSMAVKNYADATHTYQQQPAVHAPETASYLEQTYFAGISALEQRMLQNPAEEALLKDFEKLDTDFRERIVFPWRVKGVEVSTHDDVFTGKMLSTYFHGWDDFLRTFDHYSGIWNDNTHRPEPEAWQNNPLSFSVHGGPLYGEYWLSPDCQRLWKGLEAQPKEDYYAIRSFSPIHFQVELPAGRAERVQSLFETLKQQHPQVFSEEELVKC